MRAMHRALYEDYVLLARSRGQQKFFSEPGVLFGMFKDNWYVAKEVAGGSPGMHSAQAISDEMPEMAGYRMSHVKGDIDRWYVDQVIAETINTSALVVEPTHGFGNPGHQKVGDKCPGRGQEWGSVCSKLNVLQSCEPHAGEAYVPPKFSIRRPVSAGPFRTSVQDDAGGHFHRAGGSIKVAWSCRQLQSVPASGEWPCSVAASGVAPRSALHGITRTAIVRVSCRSSPSGGLVDKRVRRPYYPG